MREPILGYLKVPFEPLLCVDLFLAFSHGVEDVERDMLTHA